MWEYEYETSRRGALLGIFNSLIGQLRIHEFLVAELFQNGKVQKEEEYATAFASEFGP